MAQTVVGIFDSKADAQKAVQELRNIGFSIDRVDTSNATIEKTGSTSSSYKDSSDDDGIGGFFKSLFNDDDYSANRYSDVARQSDSVVTVHADSQEEARKAAEVLDKYGSVDVEERSMQYGRTNETRTTGTDSRIGETQTGKTNIPIIEENLEVGKREVETGGARLRSRIVERPVEEHLRLRSEHIKIERTEANRPATEADFNNFKEGEMNITERAEVPVVNKEARVVGEVSLGKEVEERDEVIRDTVRSTEVDVDRTGGDTTNNTNPGLDRDRTDLNNDRNKI